MSTDTAGPWWSGPFWAAVSCHSAWTIRDYPDGRVIVRSSRFEIIFESLEDAVSSSEAAAFGESAPYNVRPVMLIAWGAVLIYLPRIRADRLARERQRAQ